MTLTGHRGCINTCSFNPYGDFELTGCDDGCVWLWDIGNRCPTPKLMLRPHISNVFTTNFLSHSRFVSGANDAAVQVIDVLPDGSVQATQYANHHIRKVHGSFVIDQNTFATCAHDGTVRLFDVRTRYRNQQRLSLPTLTEADLNYDGSSRLGDDLRRHNIRPQGEGGGSWEPIPESRIDDASLLLDFRRRRGGELFQMDVHPIDRKRFLTTGRDGTVRLFDMRMIHRGAIGDWGFSVNQHYRSEKHVTGAAFDGTGDRIAASVIGGNIHVLDAHSFVDLTTVRPVQTHRAFFPFYEEEDDEGDRPGPRGVAPRVPVTGELIELRGHRSVGTIKTCNWFGDFVVTGSDEGDVYFYDPVDGQIISILQGHKKNVNVVTVHKEKRLLATSGVDSYAILWEPTLASKTDLKKARKNADDIQEEHRQNPPIDYGCSVM
jgi:WD40 repeat protein